MGIILMVGGFAGLALVFWRAADAPERPERPVMKRTAYLALAAFVIGLVAVLAGY